jgi:hypothetical protein
MALNPCELEIDLFCSGMRVPDEVPLTGARGVSRTRAGLGSGLEIVIPTDSWLKEAIWMNVPVAEAFAHQSPYVLRPTFRRRLRPAGRREIVNRPAGSTSAGSAA